MFRTEGQALSFIRSRIAKGTFVNADEGSSWDALHAQYEMKRINHEEAYGLDGACTNWAEEFFSRMRRAEQGHHHHIAGPYLLRYAQEDLMARRSPHQQWQTGSLDFRAGDDERSSFFDQSGVAAPPINLQDKLD